MESALTFASLAAVKSAIAHAWLGTETATVTLGSVTLRPHQRDAVERIRHTLDRERTALLADDVGLGKTYVAIAVAATARAPLIVSPAALRDMWREALSAAGVRARWTSYEQLSRRVPDLEDRPDLVVLDEAHHARNPATHRYARLATLTAGARVLLLSATPIHNRRADLSALFALALGRSARTLDDREIAARTVRRTVDDVPSEPLPALVRHDWIRVPDDDALLERLLALPPPLPPRDAGQGGVLLTWTLVRLWASTRGALRAALRRRVQRAWALRHALASGAHPSRDELAAWQCSDLAVQLAFPEMVASPAANPRELLHTVERHADAVEQLVRDLATGPNPDLARARALRALRADTPHQRILVFTQFADSAAAIWRLLRDDPGVAVLTAKGAQVAGGTISRREALARFAPSAMGTRPPMRAQSIDLLISTDLLSEGVNLQDAAIVVHLDLPWTHARLAQRVGRVRRMGSTHAAIRVLTFAPPAAAERLLEVERRIAAKLGDAARTLGIAGAILPSLLGDTNPDASPARAAERMRALLGQWRGNARPPGTRPVACIVWSSCDAALAALSDRAGRVVLVASTGQKVSDDPRAILGAIASLDDATPCEPDESLAVRECRRVERWADARAAERAAGGAISIGGAGRRATIRRVATIVARTPLARRHETASLAAAVRRIAARPIGIGGEMILGQLASAPMTDDAWLRAVAAFGEAHGSELDPGDSHRPRVLAILLSRRRGH